MAGRSAPLPPKKRISAKASSRLQNGISQYFFFSIIFLKIKIINPVVVVGSGDSVCGALSFNSLSTEFLFNLT